MVVIVFGLPGSGKSYFSRKLADLMNANYINSDILRKEMFKVRSYSEKEKNSVYTEMLSQMKMLLDQGKNLVLDASFYKSSIREKFIRETGGSDRVVFIEIAADEALIRERLKRRRMDSEADFEVYKKIRAQWEPMNEPHLILQSTDNNIENMLKKAASFLPIKNDKPTDR